MMTSRKGLDTSTTNNSTPTPTLGWKARKVAAGGGLMNVVIT